MPAKARRSGAKLVDFAAQVAYPTVSLGGEQVHDDDDVLLIVSKNDRV